MRNVDIRERTVPISRYADPSVAPGGLTTSIVAVVTDAPGNGGQLAGYGFASIGRFAQGGLIRERFAPRLLQARPEALLADNGKYIDPLKAWDIMMTGEKQGGHGERCVAVGALDMALWDLAGKAVEQPLHRLLSDVFGISDGVAYVPVYAGGGYYFPSNDIARLRDEAQSFIDLDRKSVV